MKRIIIGLAALAMLVLPVLSYAQEWGDMEYDAQGPVPYNDVVDGQLLKLSSYVLMPIGYGLEWGIFRPLHNLATNTAAAPVLSGDTDIRYFGESSNANLLPPGTFRPFQMPANPTQMDTSTGPLPMPATTAMRSSTLPPVQGYQPTRPGAGYAPSGQAVIH
jgi:hypothetical protein